jgi:hypothetical protein
MEVFVSYARIFMPDALTEMRQFRDRAGALPGEIGLSCGLGINGIFLNYIQLER